MEKNLNFVKAVKSEKEPLLQQPEPMVIFERSSFPELEERQRLKTITPVCGIPQRRREQPIPPQPKPQTKPK